jgi:hypothetical protein
MKNKRQSSKKNEFFIIADHNIDEFRNVQQFKTDINKRVVLTSLMFSCNLLRALENDHLHMYSLCV